MPRTVIRMLVSGSHYVIAESAATARTIPLVENAAAVIGLLLQE